MPSCLQNFFQVHQRLLRRWDLCQNFYFFLEQLLEFANKHCFTKRKVQMKCFFFIAEFERAAKIRKIAVYRFLISLLVPEL